MNTKHILRYTAACVAALAVLACSKDDTTEPGTPETPGTTAPYTITATMDDGSSPDTRISATDDGSIKIELKWKADDKIYVVNSTNAGTTSAGTLYTFTCTAISSDGKTASFTCADYPSDATPAFAIHQGYFNVTYFNPTNVTIDITGYKSAASSLPSNEFQLWAKYDSATRQLVFKPLTAVLKLNITLPEGASGTLSRLRIGSADGSDIFYFDYYNITSGTAVRSGSGMINAIILTGSSQFTGNTENSVYLPVLAGTELLGQALEIDLIVGSSVYTTTIKGSGLEAGKCYPLTLGSAKWTLVGSIYEAGTGSAETPYEIASEANLRALARAVRADMPYDNKHFKLTASISGIQTTVSEPWLPIGGSNSSFNGNFNGNGQTVGGTFHLADKDGGYLGFFGYCDNISNLTLEGNMYYQSSGNPYVLYLGGIVGKASGSITGCTHKGSLTAENTTATQSVYAGGIVGDTSGSITGCTQTGGTITVNTPNCFLMIGGIAGYFYGSSAVMHTSRSESDITATGKTSSGGTKAGALAGKNNGTIYDCSTFLEGITVTVNGTAQNPVKAIGFGYSGYDVPQPCPPDSHPVQ